MLKSNHLKWITLLTLLEGGLGLAFLLASPSEAGSARLLGFSWARLGFAGAVLVLLLALAWVCFTLFFQKSRAEKWTQQLEGWLLQGDRLYLVQLAVLGLFVFAAGAFLFTWLFILPYLRGLITWAGLSALQAFILIRVDFRSFLKEKQFGIRNSLRVQLSSLNATQRRVLLLLMLVGSAYFIGFMPVNEVGISDLHTFNVRGGDEVVIYPILTSILTLGKDFSTTLYHIFIYEDYHYGYPFYAASALALLPGRLLAGDGFAARTQGNLLVLREVISVLPMALSAMIFTWLATRYRKWWLALGVFVLILTIPGVIKFNTRFWHPDALALLFVALTFLFLDCDRLRLGRNWYLAALFCGLATATRLLGPFFVLAVAGYLVAALALKKGTWKQVVLAGLGFVLVMGATTVLANPFLFNGEARARFTEIMVQKGQELAFGYAEPDPQYIYRIGLDAWLPFFTLSYGETWFLALLTLITVAASIWSTERAFPALLLGWCLVMGGYLVLFVAVKSFQYMLPLFVPLYAAPGLLGGLFAEGSRLPAVFRKRGIQIAVWAVVLTACAVQFVINLMKIPAILSI